MKTVIFVWQDQLSDKSRSLLPGPSGAHYWGLGDVIRGMLSTASVCDQLNVKFCADIRHHSFGKYFNHVPHGYEKFVDENLSHVRMIDWCGMQSVVSNQGNKYQTKTLAEHIETNGDVVLLFTNHMLDAKRTDVYHKYIPQVRQSFTPTDYSIDIYKKRCEHVHIPDKYQLAHLRLGDVSFSRHHHVKLNMSYDIILKKIHNNLLDRGIAVNNTLLISDNSKFLSHAKNANMGYMIHVPEELAHVGIKCKTSALENTLIDMLLIMHSDKNYTFTVYNHPSGFVVYTSMLAHTDMTHQNILEL